MKNTKYFPFERVNYFYGKLLSVEDFRLEQKYGNDKRRMLNRFLYGAGVVTGMNVVPVDNTTVLIESGLALDASGREIVIDEPEVCRLQTLEGFSDYEEDRNTGYLYLCIAYEEEETEPVHSISQVGKTNSGAFNKIRESYRLYLTRNEPETDYLSDKSLYESAQTICWTKGIRVKHILPKFVPSGGRMELKIEVENMGQQENFAFSYELELNCLSYEGRSRLSVSFDELLFEKSGRYTFSYMLDVFGVKDTQAMISIVPKSFKLRIGQNQTEEKAEGKSYVYVSGHSQKDEVARNYFEKGMEHVLQDGSSQDLYLAKISLLRAGDTVVIDKVEKMPFGQYVASSFLNHALLQMDGQEGRDSNESEGRLTDSTVVKRSDNYGISIAEGEEEIELGVGASKGKKLFSREISHGLGMGRTTIILSQEGTEAKEAYFGVSGIFKADLPQIELAAKTDAQKGTFTIGVHVLSTTAKERIRIHWTAIQDKKELLQEKKERHIFIRPNVLNLNTRESYYLEAVCSNMTDTAINWKVKNHGGTIDENGLYTAPNTAGVYEVTAESVAYPEVKASIFVIVREKENDYSEL